MRLAYSSAVDFVFFDCLDRALAGFFSSFCSVSLARLLCILFMVNNIQYIPRAIGNEKDDKWVDQECLSDLYAGFCPRMYGTKSMNEKTCIATKSESLSRQVQGAQGR